MNAAGLLRRDADDHPFLFATGLECSYPTIVDETGRRIRMDEYEKTDHYRRWREDFALVQHLGIDWLRYGAPWYRAHPGPGQYDWAFADETFGALRDLGITPIADLCHFGLPDWIGSFQNPDFPRWFAEYAAAFAERFSWVTFFTPINEIRIACEFSALMGWWNERLTSDDAFVTAVVNCARATVLAEEAILDVQPHAVFVQSEATSCFHAETPDALDRARFLNERRFLPLDLCYGHDVSATMLEFLLSHGMRLDEYWWLMEHGRRLMPACVMGNDYYAQNEQIVPPDDRPLFSSGPVYGYYVLTRHYYERYGLPVMHTETNNLATGDGCTWLRNQWQSLTQLKRDGVPIVGFTWYSLIDQVDWDSGLRVNAGHVNPIGLYSLDRRPHPVADAYRRLIREWRGSMSMAGRHIHPRSAATARKEEAPGSAALHERP